MKSKQNQTPKTNASKKPYWTRLILLVILGVTSSCGGGGTLADGGIGGTGVISFGPVTALGSIFVNNVEYVTTQATVTIDGVDSDDGLLQVGMVVKVEGTINPDGKTGIANLVVFDDNVEGPVETIDTASNSLQVMGQTVLIDAQTIFAGSAAPWILSDLVPGDQLEVSGLEDNNGKITATRLTWKSGGSLSAVEVSGPIINLTNSSFTINNLTVDYSSAALEGFNTLGLQPGVRVEVKGLFNQTVLIADRILKKSAEFMNNDDLEITGLINTLAFDGVQVSGFTLTTPAGIQQIQIVPGTSFSGGVNADLTIGTRVEIEGNVQNNIIQADQVFF